MRLRVAACCIISSVMSCIGVATVDASRQHEMSRHADTSWSAHAIATVIMYKRCGRHIMAFHELDDTAAPDAEAPRRGFSRS